MLKDESARQNRQGVPVDCFWVERNDRYPKKVSDHTEEFLFVDFSGVEDLRGPGTAIHVLGKLGRFLSGGNAAGQQKIDNGLAGSLIHLWALILPQIARNAALECGAYSGQCPRLWMDRAVGGHRPG